MSKTNNIEVTEVKIYSVKHDTLKANAAITLNGVFVIGGVKVIKGKKGLFVTMPQYNHDNEWKDLCYPITKELRDHITKEVIDAYENR